MTKSMNQASSSHCTHGVYGEIILAWCCWAVHRVTSQQFPFCFRFPLPPFFPPSFLPRGAYCTPTPDWLSHHQSLSSLTIIVITINYHWHTRRRSRSLDTTRSCWRARQSFLIMHVWRASQTDPSFWTQGSVGGWGGHHQIGNNLVWHAYHRSDPRPLVTI